MSEFLEALFGRNGIAAFLEIIDGLTSAAALKWYAAGGALALILAIADRRSLPSPIKADLSVEAAAASKTSRWIGALASSLMVLIVFSLLTAVFNRFWSVVGIGLVLIVLLWAGNRLKVRILDEPLVFSDVFLAGHALRYPRLYFGYAPLWIWPLLAVVAILIVGVVANEAPLGLSYFERAVILFLDAGLLWFLNEWARHGGRVLDRLFARHPLKFKANVDAWTYTPMGAALLHLLWHARNRQAIRARFRFAEPVQERQEQNQKHSSSASVNASVKALADGAEKPASSRPLHLLLVQAESFCRIGQKLKRPSVVPAIDALIQAGSGGALSLDWRGAYTMRSEFAVLTGISPEETETYGFDPYRLAAMEPMVGIARDMKAQGYRTVAWHPNDGRFFNRIEVMPNLGFDAFMDLDALDAWAEKKIGRKLPRFGRYVDDGALLRAAAEFLEACSEPTFLFVITMEAHGPWDAACCPGGGSMSEVERYESHMRRLDEGAAHIAEESSAGHLRAVAFLYGDHIPGLKALDEAAGAPRTPAENAAEAETAWVFPARSRTSSLPEKLRPEDIREILRREITST